jgi:hypothetical protein
MYMKTGSLSVPTLAHGFYDFITYFLFGNAKGILLFQLSSELSHFDKLIYKIVLSIILIAVTYFFFGKSPLLSTTNNKSVA